MIRVTPIRSFGALAVVSAVLVGGAVIGLPEYIARQADKAAQTCLNLTDQNRRCRFIGGPLEMSGKPVYMGNFQQAFLPTKEKLEFVDAGGNRWVAPAQTLTDGATIPTLFTFLVGDRQSEEFLLAAVLHDAYCGVGNEALDTYWARPWEEVHRMFYEALLANGTEPQIAKLMYAAVYLGGPRWDDPERDLSDIDPKVLLREMEWCEEWIREFDPTPEEIQKWMREREQLFMSGAGAAPSYSDANDPRGL